MPQLLKDMSGMKFGRLTVICREGNTSYGKPLWKCQCECGNITYATRRHLLSGSTSSCGCFRRDYAREQHTTHGLSRNGKVHNRLYGIWGGVKDRCCNPKSKYWDRYGGRGISICEEWETDYMTFHNWAMANGYQENLTLDRIDNSKGYSPDNCRWTTYEVQENNRSNNVLYKVDGEILTLAQLARKDGTSRRIAEINHEKEKYYG